MMETFIQELCKKFKESSKSNNKELVNGFEQYLKSNIEHLDGKSLEFIKRDLEIATNILIESDLDTKKKILIKDENCEKIREISSSAFDTAKKVLNGEKISTKMDVEEKKNQLLKLLQKVKSYNKDEANQLVSEALLDLAFISNSDSKMTSLRLWKVIMKKQQTEEYER